MTSAYALDIQDIKNEVAADANEDLEELETRQAAARKSEQECYGRAFKYRNVAKAAEDAICALGLDNETFLDVQYVHRVALATCQVWIDEAKKSCDRAERIGLDIRCARFCREARKNIMDFSEGHDTKDIPTAQERDEVAFSK
jgi:hypothetical protein